MMLRRRSARLSWFTLFILGSSMSLLHAVTLQTLREDAHLTPERFASYFHGFKFKAFERLQRTEVFLASRTGDCDDYAVLAAAILRERGYTTRLIVVFMPKEIHVVCYVVETRSYLDFNNRRLPVRTAPSGSELAEIAEQVARSFGSNWYCVSEFIMDRGERRFVETDFPRTPQVRSSTSSKPVQVAER
jgi:hypothetical protein